MSEIPSNDDKSQNISELLENELKDFEYSSEAASTISEGTDHSSIDTEYMLRQFLLKPLDNYDILELILRFMFAEPVFQIEDLNFSLHNNNTLVLLQFFEEIINTLNADKIINYFDDVFGTYVSEYFAEFMADKSESQLKNFFQDLLKIPTKILENIETTVICEHEFTLELLMEILKEYDYDIYPLFKRFYDVSPSIFELFKSANKLKLGKRVLKYMKAVKEYLENQKNSDDENTKRRKFGEFIQFIHK